ncbi:MAG: hypothetical protein Q7K39_04680 [Candidatus Magasanikbacteria bacterium]|nr:hypothetical protein [Candidatus Magasanikbacteria bacterium]
MSRAKEAGSGVGGRSERHPDSLLVNLENLDLASLPWQQKGRWSGAGAVGLLVTGEKFTLLYTKTTEPDNVGNECERFFVAPEATAIQDSSMRNEHKSLLWMRVEFFKPPKLPGASASTAIFRNEKSRKIATVDLPKGTGVILYEKLLNFVATAANRFDKPVRHQVTRVPGMAERIMTKAQWDKIFSPLLTKHGYRSTNNGDTWEKTYQPDTPLAK